VGAIPRGLVATPSWPVLAETRNPSYNLCRDQFGRHLEERMGVKKTGKGRRKLGQKKRRMRAKIRHRKG
jgi:hypothetical protein